MKNQLAKHLREELEWRLDRKDGKQTKEDIRKMKHECEDHENVLEFQKQMEEQKFMKSVTDKKLDVEDTQNMKSSIFKKVEESDIVSSSMPKETFFFQFEKDQSIPEHRDAKNQLKYARSGPGISQIIRGTLNEGSRPQLNNDFKPHKLCSTLHKVSLKQKKQSARRSKGNFDHMSGLTDTNGYLTENNEDPTYSL